MVYWNIKTIIVPTCKTITRMGIIADERVRAAKCAKTGDNYVLVAGSPGEEGKTDWLQIRNLS